MKRLTRRQFVLGATGGYAVLALAWIFLSDRLLLAFTDVATLVRLSTAKGVFFVAVSSILLFFALRAVPAAEQDQRQGTDLLALVANSIRPVSGRYWLRYLLALVLAVLMLVIRQSLVVGFGQRPLLILFMFPIIVSALLGGLGPGLLATTVAALGIDYLAIPPVGSLRIAAGHDLIQWGFLLVNGVAVSLLSEFLRQALQRSEVSRRLLETVIEGSSNAVFVKDRRGRYLIANQATAQFLGKQQSEIVGHDDRALFPESSASQIMATDREIMAKAETHTFEEYPVMPDGKELIFSVTKGPVLDEQGRVIGLFGISRNITESRQAEEEIRRLNETLELRVFERTAELQASNQELENQSYAIAHNLRAPLRAMDGFSQALLDDFGQNMPDGMRSSLEQIRAAAQQMGSLIDALLALSRCRSAQLQPELVDISALAEKIKLELQRHEPGRRVNWQLEPGIQAWGDARLLEVVMRNLLDNAWKCTAQRDAALIRVSCEEAAGLRRVCVSDNGIGFDMRHQALLFQPFQRLHRQDELKGVGIGLTLVQQIIQRHGGTVQAKGEPGQGASICFELPVPRQRE